ncbi:LORF7 [Gallid alphaherpesvirus 2]|nr:LORF7 [Gallid alphaherpesvirus 2]
MRQRIKPTKFCANIDASGLLVCLYTSSMAENVSRHVNSTCRILIVPEARKKDPIAALASAVAVAPHGSVGDVLEDKDRSVSNKTFSGHISSVVTADIIQATIANPLFSLDAIGIRKIYKM